MTSRRHDDGTGMSPLWSSKKPAADVPDRSGLTPTDRIDFSRLNDEVQRGVMAAKVLVAAGKALAAIRERQLFRVVCDSWEAYCDRVGIDRRRADQMCQAGLILEGIETKLGNAFPGIDEMSESTVRQLAGMTSEEAAEAVVEAASSPEGITPKSIRRAAGKRRKKTSVKAPRPRRLKCPGGLVMVTVNRKGLTSGMTVVSLLRHALAQALAEEGDEDNAAAA